jgi:hypothetical protein
MILSILIIKMQVGDGVSPETMSTVDLRSNGHCAVCRTRKFSYLQFTSSHVRYQPPPRHRRHRARAICLRLLSAGPLAPHHHLQPHHRPALGARRRLAVPARPHLPRLWQIAPALDDDWGDFVTRPLGSNPVASVTPPSLFIPHISRLGDLTRTPFLFGSQRMSKVSSYLLPSILVCLWSDLKKSSFSASPSAHILPLNEDLVLDWP